MTASEALSPTQKRSLLLKLMRSRLSGYAGMLAPENQAGGLERFAISASELASEAELDEGLTFDAPTDQGPTEPTAVLLTGATGFLGAYLLDGLLSRTQARIYCLVRAGDCAEGQRRIFKALSTYMPYGDWPADRIIPVPGDLAKPRYGLSVSEFAALAETLDCIHHNGAMVHGLYSYPQLKAANVDGTLTAIRLAGLGTIKPLHYVSTLAACPLQDGTEASLVPEVPLARDGTLYGGYPQSKWVAEQLVTAAQARGLPVTVYRPGIITGHSRTGAWSTSDATCRLIKTAVESGMLPDTEAALDMTPVDYVSDAIVQLSTCGGRAGRIYHLANPQPITLRELVSWLRDFGYPVRRVPYEDWRAEVLAWAQRSPDNPLSPLLPLFGVGISGKLPQWIADAISGSYRRGLDRVVTAVLSQYGDRALRFDRERTGRALSGTGIACPTVNSKVLHTYLSTFVRTGYLPAPT